MGDAFVGVHKLLKVVIVSLLAAVPCVCCVSAAITFYYRGRAMEFDDIAFSRALERLSAATLPPMKITPQEGKAAKRGDTTVMTFVVSETDLRAFEAAFGMKKGLMRDGVPSEEYEDWPQNALLAFHVQEVEYQLQKIKRVPWLREWEGAQPALAGYAIGAKYELYFVGLRDQAGPMKLFVMLDTWSTPRVTYGTPGLVSEGYVLYGEGRGWVDE